MPMAFKMRSTKFRHVYGRPFRKEQCFENVRITRNAHDSHFCAVNTKFLAVVTESAGGGSFIVLPIDKSGRVDINTPKVCGHSGAVMDIKWSPFNDNVIASGSDDSTIKVWEIPKEGLLSNLTEWSVDLHGHQRKVAYLEWHPTAENILLSAGFDSKCIIWNVEQAEPVNIIEGHNDNIFSMFWNNDGSLFCTTSKDKRLRVIDPRRAQVVVETDCHQGYKTSKSVFLRDNNRIFTTGFSRTSERQYALWDVRNMDLPIVMNVIDFDSGTLLPYYDPDLNIVYVAGKGNGNIRYYEMASEDPYVHFLNSYQSPSPQRGLSMMPKRGCDVTTCEVLRFYKLHAAKNLIEPISMICPRKSDKFQEDIYPPTHGTIPSLSADEWISGQNREPILVSVADGHVLNTPKITTSKAVQKQEGVLNLAPTITTYKAVNKQNRENRSAPKRANTIATDTIINNNHQEPASLRNIKRLSTNEDYVSIKPTESQRIHQQAQSKRDMSQKQVTETETVRPLNTSLDALQCDILSDFDDNLPDTLYDFNQDIADWQEETLSDSELRLDEFDVQSHSPVFASYSKPYKKRDEPSHQRSYQQQPEPPKPLEPEAEDQSQFLQMKEAVKRNLEIKPNETSSSKASIYEKERERIRPFVRSASEGGLRKSLYDNEQDITAWQEETLRRPKGLPPVSTEKLIAASRNLLERNVSRSMKKQVQKLRKGDAENYKPEEEANPSFSQAKRYVQKQASEASRPKSMVDMDIGRLDPDLVELQQRSSKQPGLMTRQRSLEKDEFTHEQFTQAKRLLEQQSKPGPPVSSVYRQSSLENEPPQQIIEDTPPPYPLTRRSYEPHPKEESPKRPPKAGSTSPFAKRRDVRSSEAPSSNVDKSFFTNRPSFPKLKCEQIVSSRPFVPLEMQTVQDKYRDQPYSQPTRLREKQSPPPPLPRYRQNSSDKEPDQSEEQVPTFSQARRSFESPKEESPQRFPKSSSLSPFAKRKEIRSTPVSTKEKAEYVSPFSNRASYPQTNQENVSARSFGHFEVQSPQEKRGSFDKSYSKRIFEFPSPSPTELGYQPLYGGSQPSLHHRMDINSQPAYMMRGSQQQLHDHQRESFNVKNARHFDYQPVQKVEPYQPLSDNRRGSVERRDTNFRPPEEQHRDKFVSKASFAMNTRRAKETSNPSPTTDVTNRTSHPPVTSKRYEPVVPQSYENDVDIAAWEEEALRHYEPRQSRPANSYRRPADRRSGSTSPKVFLREKYPPPPPSPRSKVEGHSDKNTTVNDETNSENVSTLAEVTSSPITDKLRGCDDDVHDISFVKNGDSASLRVVKIKDKESSSVIAPEYYFEPVRQDSDDNSSAETIHDDYNSDTGAADFSERKAMFETSPSPVDSPAASRVEKRVWSPTSPIYKDPSTNGVSDSDKELPPIMSSTAVFRPSNGTTESTESPRKRRPNSEIVTSAYTNANLAKLVIGEPTIQPTHKIHVRKMWQQPQTISHYGEDNSNAPNTDAELKKAYFRQQDEIRQLQEQIALKDKRIRQLEEEVRGVRETSCGPGESNC